MSDEHDDPTLESEMREVLRRMARALISNPDELQRRYNEIDKKIANLQGDSNNNSTQQE